MIHLLACSSPDIFISDSKLVILTKQRKFNDIEKYLNDKAIYKSLHYPHEGKGKGNRYTRRLEDYNTYMKYDIKNAIKVTNDLEIVELLASYLNKPIMKNIIDIQRKRNIWKYVFNWLTKPITNDGLLGIDARLGLKYLDNLECAPLKL
jgi:hypothetical protein